MADEVVKDTADLVGMGGRFYEIGGEALCDTPLDTWRLVPGKGWVKYDDRAEQELGGEG